MPAHRPFNQSLERSAWIWKALLLVSTNRYGEPNAGDTTGQTWTLLAMKALHYKVLVHKVGLASQHTWPSHALSSMDSDAHE